MPISITVQKQGSNLLPVTDYDREQMNGMIQGRHYRVDVVNQSDRSIRHHRLFFGGLLALLADYWEPKSGLVSKYDRWLLRDVLKFVSSHGFEHGALEEVFRLYVQHRSEKLKGKIPEIESAKVRLDTILIWLKEEVGHYDVEYTPTGYKKVLKSINFNSMKDEEFRVFYKKCFSVAWRYVFSKVQFDSQEQAENVAMQMADMG